MPPITIRSLCQLTPFKTGCLVVLISSVLFFSFGSRKPSLLTRLDNQVFDAMFQWRGSTLPSTSVVIVDIDEKSLAKLGQWPWPRNIVAQLIENISRNQAKVIGLDIIFAENDRTSPKNVIKELTPFLAGKFSKEEIDRLAQDELLDHDLILGDTVASTPTVLGYVFQTANDQLRKVEDKPFPSINIAVEPQGISFAKLPLIHAYRAIVNVPDVAMAQTEGFFNVFPDPAGTVRKVPLFIEMDGVPYPSLALETLRQGLGIGGVTIHASPQSSVKGHGILGISLGDRFIPTDNAGQVTINYRGPTKTFPYYSAVDVMAGLVNNELKNKFVLIGTSAVGLLDLRATPYANVFPGVEVHANLIDNILSGDPFSHDLFTEIGLTYTVIIFGGLLLSALLAYSSPVIGGVGGLLLIVLYLFYGNYKLLFLQHQMIGITYPLATILAIFLMVTMFNYFIKDREKRFIQGAFGHYVSPQVVNQLIKAPKRLTLAGEERELTIFFNDIRGFTSISEQMTSQELGLFMNEYLTRMSNVIMEHKGTVDKYIGDAIMALWGAPLDDELHAENAVRASLEMMEILHNLQPEWINRGLPPIDIGIGLNTGRVSVGNFGSEQRFDYTVLGDNVNLASRLEGLNKLYGTNILISGPTREATLGKFFCRFIDMVRVQGKKRPVAIYQPLVEGPPEAELRLEVEAFEKALSLYRKQQFGKACEIISKLNEQKPAKLYELYLERIEAFLITPPPEDWDGTYTATSK